MVDFCGIVRVEDRGADVTGSKVVLVSSTGIGIGVEDTCKFIVFETMLVE